MNNQRSFKLVQDFAITSKSQFNIKKSKMISLMKSDLFNLIGWSRNIVKARSIFGHLEDPLVCQNYLKISLCVDERENRKVEIHVVEIL